NCMEEICAHSIGPMVVQQSECGFPPLRTSQATERMRRAMNIPNRSREDESGREARLGQFPDLRPNCLTPFTHRMPAANPGLKRPESVASYRQDPQPRLLQSTNTGLLPTI